MSVYVIGSINMDVIAQVERHPRKGETVLGDALTLLPGGKGANQAVAARRAGADTCLVGMLGTDVFGGELWSFLETEAIDLRYVASTDEASSGTALITVAGAANTIVVVPGANGRLTPRHVGVLPFQQNDVVVSQFEIPQETILAAFRRASAAGATTILNPAPAATPLPGLIAATDVLVVNESELSWLVSGTTVEEMSRDEAVRQARLIQDRPRQIVIVTLGANGAVALAADEVLYVDGQKVSAIDTTGAGDCFVGNLAARLADGFPLSDALDIANRAASISVQSLGAAQSMPCADSIDTRLAA